ncbi:MAG TPA: HIT domain-containing protein [Actinomycetota bacterium]|nr:HIT domain-containing protein [Actinomycetota bacterium]
MERLWAPWRMEYIEAPHPHDEGCVFCQKLDAGDDESAYILTRSALAFVILNAYPYNPGHLMVAPLRHVGDLEDVTSDEHAEVSALLVRSLHALKEASGPDGFNVGVNLGRVAGAGVLGHVHWHVVPRWNGDTNFMAVLGEARVLPEALAATYAKLGPLLKKS